MTIKDMEARSGVAKANIRYYEAEGLLSPQRLSNGYRTYSEADLVLLEKIKLLRRLGLSIEELRSLSRGGTELAQALDRRLEALAGERAALRRVEEVCGALREDGPTFETLEPEKYLEALDAPVPPEDPDFSAPPLPAADALPAAPGLLRRLAARCFDGYLLVSVLMAGYALSGRNPSRLGELGLAATVAVEVLLLLLEPLSIRLFGATPGKALLGLRLARPNGERLSYGEAVSRHLQMLWGALGLWIPIWSWIQIYRCCKRWSDGEPQPWDEGIAYTARPFRRKHVLAPVLACLAVLLAAEAANSFSQLPPHRGDLTVADFAENYNRQICYLSGETRELLDPEGRFTLLPDPPGTFTIHLTDDWQEKSFQYGLEGETLRSVTLVCRAEDTDDWLSLPQATVTAAVTALGWAPRTTPFFVSGRKPLLEALGQADWSRDFTLTQGGVSVVWEIESHNFIVDDSLSLAVPHVKGDNTLACRCEIALT